MLIDHHGSLLTFPKLYGLKITILSQAAKAKAKYPVRPYLIEDGAGWDKRSNLASQIPRRKKRARG
jgi:hypothetical protein